MAAKDTLFREKATSASAALHAGPLSWLNLGMEILVFVEGGKPGNFVEREKPLELGENQQRSHRAGIEPRPHWWEASTLTTAPPMLPKFSWCGYGVKHFFKLFSWLKLILNHSKVYIFRKPKDQRL